MPFGLNHYEHNDDMFMFNGATGIQWQWFLSTFQSVRAVWITKQYEYVGNDSDSLTIIMFTPKRTNKWKLFAKTVVSGSIRTPSCLQMLLSIY